MDYEKDRQRVQDLIAADIINEHEVHEDDEDPIVFRGARPRADRKTKALMLSCPRCEQPPGSKCKSASGDYTELHKARLDAVDSPAPGS